MTPLLLLCGLLSACVNQAGTADPYRVFDVSGEQLGDARRNGLPYVKSRRGQLQTIRPIEFETDQFGRVLILQNFVSDGSSRPFDNEHASNMAALLHDALYRGAPQLTFPDKYPGQWTRKQADAAYCQQLKLQKARESTQKINCRGLKILGVGEGVWKHHTERRQAYWDRQAEIERKKRVNRLFISPE
ncbi:MAG: hypothetical protein ABJM29_04985 [Rhizobiaceae bacterium]